jgi:diacylglycerol kinase (ATP)
MRNRNMLDSFNNAISGIIYAIKTQRNMKVHFLMALAVLFFCLFFNISRGEMIALFITVAFVIFAELVNTAIEAVVDIAVNEYHSIAKIAKDVAAGAVFVTAFNAIIVAYLIFSDKVGPAASSVMQKISNKPTHIVFIGLLITLVCILILKAYFRKGTPFQGGMPSGHAALSFAVLTSIWMLAHDVKVFALALVLSLLVIQSRVETKIHSFFEVFFGAVVGTLIMLILFQIVGNFQLFHITF